jgi:hypothetical protein
MRCFLTLISCFTHVKYDGLPTSINKRKQAAKEKMISPVAFIPGQDVLEK